MHKRASPWALAISLAAALLLLWVLARPAGTLRPVVVVTRDLVPGERLARAALDFRDLPEKYVEDRHIAGEDVDRLIGARLTTAVASGASLLWTDLAVAEPERSLSSLVQVGMRALSLPSRDFGGQLRSGDRVDVLFTPRVAQRDPSDQAPTAALLENVLVLSVDPPPANGRPPAAADEGHVVVGLSPGDAQRVARHEGRGPLRLALRNPHDVALAGVFDDAPEGP